MKLKLRTIIRFKNYWFDLLIFAFFAPTTSHALEQASSRLINLNAYFEKDEIPSFYIQNNVIYALSQQDKSFKVWIFDSKTLTQKKFSHLGKFLGYSGEYYLLAQGKYLLAVPLDTRKITKKWSMLPEGETVGIEPEIEDSFSKNWNLVSVLLSSTQGKYKIGYFLLSNDLSKFYYHDPQECFVTICRYSLYEDTDKKPWMSFSSHQINSGAVTTVSKESNTLIDPSNNGSYDIQGKVFKIDHGIVFSQKQVGFGCDPSTTVLYIKNLPSRMSPAKGLSGQDTFEETSPCDLGAITFSDASIVGTKINVFSSEHISQSYKADNFPESRKTIFSASDTTATASHLYTTENYVILAASEKFCAYEKILLSKKFCFRNPYSKNISPGQISFVETKNGLGFYTDQESYSNRWIEINLADFPK